MIENTEPSEFFNSSNVCQDCGVTLEIRGNEYVCPSCGRLTQYLDGSFVHDSSNSTGDSFRHNGCASDPLRELFDNIMSMLIARFEAYSRNKKEGDVPPISMASTVARIFVEMHQQSQIHGPPIARRGAVRDEILAQILLSECNRARIEGTLPPNVRIRKYDITSMLGLNTDGFARGKEQILRQAEMGNVIIDTDRDLYRARIVAIYDKSIGVYIRDHHAHMESLLSEHHLRFICQVIDISVSRGIGNRSQIQSRIVGAIWYIVKMMSYRYSAQQLEHASDGIKSGTFNKFTRIIAQNSTMQSLARLYFPSNYE